MKYVEAHSLPNRQDFDKDAGFADQSAEPLRWGDKVFLPSTEMNMGMAGTSAEAPGVVVMLNCGQAGLYVRLTPDGARSLAQAMLGTADQADRTGAARAREQLAAALRKGAARG